MRRNYLFCLGLAIITLASFWGVGRPGFIIYDDWDYVYKNPDVQSGINFKSIQWAFTTAHSSNWHPLTWLSHMLDYQGLGLNASGHHWVNLWFHAANTLLLYLVLWEMTGARWRSFLVAALFACHPMHIQSVAWISERKDVLSGFFMMLTLWAYARYVSCARGKVSGERRTSNIEHRTSNAEREDSRSTQHALPRRNEVKTGSRYYLLCLFSFALGLMSKPMLVTLPVILLLLDFWPLGRISDFGFRISDLKNAIQLPILRRLLWEKLPFLALSLASCIVTVWAQRSGNSVIALTQIDWSDRYLHAVLSYSL